MGKIINRVRQRQTIKQHREQSQASAEALDAILRSYAAMYGPPPAWFIGLLLVAIVGLIGYGTYVVFWIL